MGVVSFNSLLVSLDSSHMAITKKTKVHVLAVPYPAQGHINPLLQLCIQLVPRGFTFTFVNTHHNHERMLQSHSINGETCVDQNSPIHMVSIAGGCPPELHGYKASAPGAFQAAQDMQEPLEHLVASMEEQGDSISFVLSDILLGWSQISARKFGVPRMAFWAASAATCSAFLHFSDLAAQGRSVPVETEGADAPLISGIPGLPPSHVDVLPEVWDQTGNFMQFRIQLVLSHFQVLDQASYLLLNSFHELEGAVVDALSCRIPTIAVGPLLPSHYMAFHTRTDSEEAPFLRPSLFPEDGTCLAWLNRHAPSSVLFISFGSISVRSDDQMVELAEGLKASGCPFLWIRRPNHASVAELNSRLADFVVGTQDEQQQGLVVPWAPQLQVLSHPSIGGFLTHCGWNSVMESVAMGVPMLCWADTGERMSNQRFVVDFWKCGMEMTLDRRAKPHVDNEAVLVGREEVERTVRAFMLEKAGATVRARATQLKVAAMTAFLDSCNRLDEFAQAMKEMCQKLELER